MITLTKCGVGLTCCRAREHERQHEQRQQGQPHALASVACRRVRRSALVARRRGTAPGGPRPRRHVRAHPPTTRATSRRCTVSHAHPWTIGAVGTASWRGLTRRARGASAAWRAESTTATSHAPRALPPPRNARERNVFGACPVLAHH